MAAYMRASADSDLLKELKGELKTIPLVTAFMTDPSLGTFQIPSRAMPFSVMVRQNTGLHSWNTNPSMHSRVASVSFKGVSLFRDGLECFLIEDKAKVLLSKKSFRSHRKFHS